MEIMDDLVETVTEALSDIVDAQNLVEVTEKSVEKNFAAIFLLAGVIVIWIIYLQIKKARQKSQVEDEPVETVAAAETAVQGTVIKEIESEEELIAVITAAISAITKKPASGFRVTSFKKRGNWRFGN